ncbi:M10 family metallopeptidase domain-containing protein [Acinetobacter colistiniresistens]|uniref:M10 family metallopeptidase domain-containing protein n=1 Tax=Acinetobacter colistiniresistens TaxID=280145 RepID=UPI00211BDE94|nr:M10 family metallopeptidase domain-containing protein [Acinetobacter colistiniresistens]UUM28174.1 M10 family metallopeptidase domain-containing protein [Acinetobacter colistiniresistens]
MRLLSLLLATCFTVLAPVSALAKIPSSASTSSQVRYSTEQPLRYRIAELDPRLNIDQPQMVELSKQAAAIWEKNTGQKYFVYDPEAEFVIHLVFDQRQLRSMKRAESLGQLEQEQQNWLNRNEKLQKVNADLAESSVQLEQQKQAYENQVQQYQLGLTQYKADNSNKTLFASLQKQQRDLQQQALKLQAKIAEYNHKVQQNQLKAEKSQQVYQELAASVAEFNETFKPEVLHKGQFDGKQIFIYEFSSIDDLRLTLAHEFGHALGLKHTRDPKSLMYPRIKDQDAKDFQLTDTDLKLLGLAN